MEPDGAGPGAGAFNVGRRGLTDDDLLDDMEQVRSDQRADLRDALRQLGPSNTEALSETTILSVFCVEQRLKEHPEWFEKVDDRWQLPKGV